MDISHDDTLVFPGQELGTSEEYVPGAGTYEENGKIYASMTGRPEYDHEEMIARVEPSTSIPVILEVDQQVIGVIIDIRGPIAVTKILKVVGTSRIISSDTSASIHISKVSEGFVPEMGRAFKIGDIIRAKIIQTKPSLQLSTAGPNFGTIYSLCGICRTLLHRHGKYCYCPNCERLWEKKVSRFYRSGEV